MTEQVTPIEISHPDAEPLTLRIAVGACTVDIDPGGTTWVTGTYRDPSGKIPISVEVDRGSARIRQHHDVDSITGLFQGGAPKLELMLGAERPFALVVEGGANEVDLSLGGVPLTRLDIKHGAGQVDLSFDNPNPSEMDRLSLATGAGTLDADGLGHANFHELVAECGAAKYELDFSGMLRRSATVRATAGAASVQLAVPSTTPARIQAKSVLGTTDVGDGFTTVGGSFLTRAAVDGSSPTLDIEASVAVGVLRLKTTD